MQAPKSPVRSRSAGKDGGAKFQREERQEFRYLLSVACAVGCSWITRTLPGLRGSGSLTDLATSSIESRPPTGQTSGQT